MKLVEPKAGRFDLTDFEITPKNCVFFYAERDMNGKIVFSFC